MAAASGVLKSISATPSAAERAASVSAISPARQPAVAPSAPTEPRPAVATQPGSQPPAGAQPAPDAQAPEGGGANASGTPTSDPRAGERSGGSPDPSGSAPERERAPSPEGGSGTAVPSAGDERSDAEPLILPTAFGARIVSAYHGFTQRIAKLLDRGATPHAESRPAESQTDKRVENASVASSGAQDARNPPPAA